MESSTSVGFVQSQVASLRTSPLAVVWFGVSIPLLAAHCNFLALNDFNSDIFDTFSPFCCFLLAFLCRCCCCVVHWLGSLLLLLFISCCCYFLLSIGVVCSHVCDCSSHIPQHRVICYPVTLPPLCNLIKNQSLTQSNNISNIISYYGKELLC